MPLAIFSNVDEKEKSTAVKDLIENSSPRQDFFLMISLSVVMATGGLLLNNVAIVIGSMLIAPLLYPLISTALGIVTVDWPLISRSLMTIVKASIFGVFLSMVMTFLFFDEVNNITEIAIINDFSFHILYVLVAVVAGLAAAFSYAKPHLNEHLPGAAIAVALIPPLALIGIGISVLEWGLVRDAILVYITNVIGIVAAGTLILSLLNFKKQSKVTEEAVKKDAKEVEAEKGKSTEPS